MFRHPSGYGSGCQKWHPIHYLRVKKKTYRNKNSYQQHSSLIFFSIIVAHQLRDERLQLDTDHALGYPVQPSIPSRKIIGKDFPEVNNLSVGVTLLDRLRLRVTLLPELRIITSMASTLEEQGRGK